MPRKPPADRVSDLIDAGTRVFARKGFRRAQMADIAREMGVSAGLLYRYVQSKEALFYLVLDRGFSLEVTESGRLPIETPAAGTMEKQITDKFRSALAMPALATALARPRADHPGRELAEVVRELYAAIARSARAVTVIERSALDMPELASLFYGRLRGTTLKRLTRLIDTRIASGQYRQVPDSRAAARLIMETATWFARNRHGDPLPDGYDDRAAEDTVVDFVVNGLLAK